MTQAALSYDDILLVPQYSDIRSRAEIDLSVDLGNNLNLQLPILSSPMDTVSESEMCLSMAQQGAAGIIHRYNTIEEQVSMAVTMIGEHGPGHVVGAAVGTSLDFIQRARLLTRVGVTFICVDVAHGHHVLMKEALHALRCALCDDIHIMAGNVATLEGVNDLADWGANSVRCNFGGGSICSTRIQTGHGLPGLHTIMECAKTDRDVAIIADGGIRNSGDMVKALALGADAVMIGSLLAGTTESPGKLLEDGTGQKWKLYRGMASKEAQMDWRGNYSSLEGVSSRVPYVGPAAEILHDLGRGIRSGLSYSGARTITELQTKATFTTQTGAGQTERRPHIQGRRWA